MTGIYVAPKFVYSYQVGENVKIVDTTLGNSEIDGTNYSTYGGALAIGYDWKPRFCVPIRTEIEGAMRSDYKHDELKVQNSTVFFNAYWDIDFLCLNGKQSPFVPYIGAGVGIAFLKAKDTDGGLDSNSETNFAWNVGAGIAYKFTKNIALDLGYRYAQFGDAKIKDASDSATMGLDGHEVMAAIRFSF